MQRRFAAHADGPLFFTAAAGLWPVFLDNTPQHLRQRFSGWAPPPLGTSNSGELVATFMPMSPCE